MILNDVLRSLRYILNVNDQKLVEIMALAGLKISLEEVQSFLLHEEDQGFTLCDDEAMSHFLDGLIIFKRGDDENRPLPPLDLPVTNNLILKKLRVAFQLKEEDILKILQNSNFKIGRSELSAFFRKQGHPNYRESGDQVLRYFLKGLKNKPIGKA